jgi:hypothetical protein
MIWDQTKSLAQMKKEQGKTCNVPSCGKPLTHMQGPGSEVLCREHQLKLVEYGGAGKINRLHTLHRKWVCDDCGVDVSEQVRLKYPTLEDPILFNRLCRNRVIGDHQIRQADGGDDSEGNIRSLCLNCNSDKTILNEDYKKSKIKTD